MRNKMSRYISVLLLTAIVTMLPQSTAYAYQVNAGNNAYYKEVSDIATALTENFKDERERDCCYSALMTGVFGEHYNDWYYNRAENDLICVIDADEQNLLLSEFADMYGPVKYYDFGDGRHYYCALNKILLNADGINEQNYTSLKSVYQAAVALKEQTEGMNVMDKARAIHDYMVARYTPGSQEDLNAHSAFYMEANGQGVCSAYMTMFLILGRYCGLDIGSIEYWDPRGTMHTINTVNMENGEMRYVDVMWDDIEGGYKYFMETATENQISHPKVEGKAAGRFDAK